MKVDPLQAKEQRRLDHDEGLIQTVPAGYHGQVHDLLHPQPLGRRPAHIAAGEKSEDMGETQPGDCVLSFYWRLSFFFFLTGQRPHVSTISQLSLASSFFFYFLKGAIFLIPENFHGSEKLTQSVRYKTGLQWLYETINFKIKQFSVCPDAGRLRLNETKDY